MSKSENRATSYAIIGFGKIGQALAKAFARKNIEGSSRTWWKESGVPGE